MSLLHTSLTGQKHRVSHADRKTSASSSRHLLLHGLKFHHHHHLSFLHKPCLLQTPSYAINTHDSKIHIHPYPTHDYCHPDGDTETRSISLTCPMPCSSYVHHSGLLTDPTLPTHQSRHRGMCVRSGREKSRGPVANAQLLTRGQEGFPLIRI